MISSFQKIELDTDGDIPLRGVCQAAEGQCSHSRHGAQTTWLMAAFAKMMRATDAEPKLTTLQR
jgi:hypothetical protein